jgi:hypothetical protein
VVKRRSQKGFDWRVAKKAFILPDGAIQNRPRKENAMKFAKRFLEKFAVSIVAILSCFDRVIFKGYLPFGDEKHLNGYVDGVLKMYDKFAVILRVETVINQPREFYVRRPCERNGKIQMAWCGMNKGVANLPRYQQVARRANDRYLDALSVVADPAPSYRQVSHLAESKLSGGRRYAGFNPARREEIRLFQAALSGDHLLRGFRNAEIRRALWGDSPDARQRRRHANAVTRRLKRLHVRGLVAKIPRTRLWRVTTRGQQLLGAMVQLHYHGLAAAA